MKSAMFFSMKNIILAAVGAVESVYDVHGSVVRVTVMLGYF